MKKIIHHFTVFLAIFMLWNIQLSIGQRGFLVSFNTSYAACEESEEGEKSDGKCVERDFKAETKVWGTSARTKINIEQYGSLLLMLAMASVTAALVIHCKNWGADTITAAAAAAVYVAQEIYAMMSYKKDLKYNLEYETNENAEIKTDEQYKMLENQADLYRKMANIAAVKAIAQEAAGAGFAAAAIIAGTRLVQYKKKEAACNMSFTKSASEVNRCAGLELYAVEQDLIKIDAQLIAAESSPATLSQVPMLVINQELKEIDASSWKAWKASCIAELSSSKPPLTQLQIEEVTPAQNSTSKVSRMHKLAGMAFKKLENGACKNAKTGKPFSPCKASLLKKIKVACAPYTVAIAREMMSCNSIKDALTVEVEHEDFDQESFLESMKSLLASLSPIALAHAKENVEDVALYDDSSPRAHGKGKLKKKSRNNYAGNKKWINLAGMASWGVAILIAMKRRSKKLAQRHIATHTGRIIVYSVFSALSLSISVISWGIHASMKENERKIRKLLVALKKIKTTKLAGGEIVRLDLSNIFPPPEDFAEGAIAEDGKAPCIYGGDGKGNCLNASGRVSKELSGFNLGVGVMKAAKLTTKIGDNLSGKKNLGYGDLKKMSQLGKGAKRLNRRLKGMLKKLGKFSLQTAHPTNYNKLIERVKAGLVTSSMAAFKREGKSPFDAVGVFGAPKMKEEDAKRVLAYAHKIKSKDLLETKGKGVDPFGSFKMEEDALLSGIDEDKLGGSETDEFEIPTSDISEQSHGNIFKMIHTRYLKTAYPTFFEKQKL